MNYKKINVLDCTLRDGGYYNYWNFNPLLVSNYLNCISKSKIKYVEIGFRFENVKSFYGPFSTSKDSFLESLDLPNTLIYGVMINAKDFFNKHQLLKKRFAESRNSKISLVRVAVNFDDFNKCQEICDNIKSKGYIVGLNLMQSHNKKEKKYAEVAKKINKWKTVDMLYFADSLGCMNSEEIKIISKKLRENWDGPLGIHAHNNKGLALTNTLEAIRNGVTWCDSTITGMGRGAGNVETEHFAIEVNERKYAKINSRFLIPAVNDFLILKKNIIGDQIFIIITQL